jgi:hypothetical protein
MTAWWRAIVFSHRWLGIAGWLVFIMWFATGIVMMYARMPAFSRAERLATLAPLDLSDARLSPSDALRSRHIVEPERVVVAMLTGRPVYRVLAHGTWTTVFADDGEALGRLSPGQALDEVRRIAPQTPTIRYDARITEPDQWTLEDGAALPLHRVALGDADDRVFYLAERTGEIVGKTTRRERWLAYAGAVPHWLYFTPLRRHRDVWAESIIWMSAAGSVMCVLGLVWGVFCGITSPYRHPQPGGSVGAPSAAPALGWKRGTRVGVTYRGCMRWHHYAGLTFGMVTFTWFFSGLLSMDPLDWHAATAPTPSQRDALSGGPLRLDRVALDDLRRAEELAPRARLSGGSQDPGASPRGAREIEIGQFLGEPRLIVDGRAGAAIDRDRLLRAARDAIPGSAVTGVASLDGYDAYYYDRGHELPLPVLRVQYADPRATWLYLDPNRGIILRKEERSSRVNRWLYHGLHSFDFPFLYNRRPLWDIVVILFIVGGMTSAVTSAAPAWRRLRRHARRLL